MTMQLPHLRADARDNRDRILTTARALFSERGLDVGMHELARRAEVGPATLYRRFPTKQALIDAAFAVELQTCREIVVEGFTAEDPWDGFTSALRRLIALNVSNRGFVDAFTAANPSGGTIAEHRRELLAMLARLARRAQAAGRLRPDFRINDATLVLLAARGLSAAGPDVRATAADRFAELAIDGFRADARAERADPEYQAAAGSGIARRP